MLKEKEKKNKFRVENDKDHILITENSKMSRISQLR